ncbi:MAG: DUF805 domain-containing protein [Candidatus Nanopelagicales bacterium]
MSFGQAIKTCFSKYFVIAGRAPRSEYWWFALFVLLVGGTLGLMALIAGIGTISSIFNAGAENGESVAGFAIGAVIVLLIAVVFYFAVLAPSIAVMVRRFHDVGLSGWWIGGYWIANVAVGIVGGGSLITGSTDSATAIANIFGLLLNLAGLAIFIVTLLPSQAGANKYGPNPLGGYGDSTTPAPPPGDYKPL